MEVYFGVDIGTSSLRCGAFDLKGRRLWISQQELNLFTDTQGAAEQDPEEVWQAFCRALTQCAAKGKPQGVGLSVYMHSLLAVGEDWNPLTPVFTWADSRAAGEGRMLGSLLQTPSLYKKTGCRFSHPMSPAAKMLWLKNHRPQVWEKAAHLVTLKEFLVHRLWGENVVDLSDASSMGLLQMGRGEWEEEMLALVGVEKDRLGALHPCTSALPPLPASMAEKLGISADTPFVLGSTDGVLANVGAGVFSQKRMTTNIGTSGALRTMLPVPYEDEGLSLWCYAFRPEMWAVGGSINNGGLVLKWLRDRFLVPLGGSQARAYALFDRWAEKVPVGCEGLVMSPALTGERSPDWNSAAAGGMHGLRPFHGIEHMARAAMEGVLFRMYSIYRLLGERGFVPGELVAGGGYARSEVWLQMQADLFDCPIQVPRETESTLLGAAYLAMENRGKVQFGQLLEGMEPVRRYEPRKETRGPWQEAYGRYQELYRRLEQGKGE